MGEKFPGPEPQEAPGWESGEPGENERSTAMITEVPVGQTAGVNTESDMKVVAGSKQAAPSMSDGWTVDQRLPLPPSESVSAVEYRIKRMRERGVLIAPYRGPRIQRSIRHVSS